MSDIFFLIIFYVYLVLINKNPCKFKFKILLLYKIILIVNLNLKMAKKKVVKTTTVTKETIITDEKTQIVCILDRSQSMSSIINEAIGGFNQFLKEQRELPDEASITVALFDNQYELLYNNVDIKETKDLTRAEWSPRGMTALYDAIGRTINDVKAAHEKLKKKDRPDKVLVCIVTDGEENSSREFRLSDIEKLIKDCEKDDWAFVYLAANQDAFEVGTGFGIRAGNTYTFTADVGGTFNMSNTLNNASVAYRSMSTSDVDYSTKVSSLMDDEGVKDDEKD
jgi:hypothetical protein